MTMQANHPLIHVAGKVPPWNASLDAAGVQRLNALMSKIGAHAKARYSKKWRTDADSLMAQYYALELEAGRLAMVRADAQKVNA